MSERTVNPTAEGHTDQFGTLRGILPVLPAGPRPEPPRPPDAARLLAAERERIARDLHDRVVQRLFGVTLGLHGSLQRASTPELRERLEDTIEQLHETVREVRAVVFDLQRDPDQAPKRPALRDRLHGIISRLTADAGLRVTVRITGAPQLLPPTLGEHVEAVVREAVSNAVRHARATRLAVSVDAGPRLAIEVVDDGTGIPEGVPFSGLRNLRKRADECGGQLRTRPADPTTGRGTRVEWLAPTRPPMG